MGMEEHPNKQRRAEIGGLEVRNEIKIGKSRQRSTMGIEEWAASRGDPIMGSVHTECRIQYQGENRDRGVPVEICEIPTVS